MAKDEKAEYSPSITVTQAPHQHFDSVYSEDTIDAGYYRKAQVLNQAVQNVGMGKYQWLVPLVISCSCSGLTCTISGVCFSSQDLAGSRRSTLAH